MQKQIRSFFNLWEDQHPLARVNVLIVLVAWAVWLILQIMVRVLPDLIALPDLLGLSIVERIWSAMSTIFLVLLGYNSLRVTWQALKNYISWWSSVMAWAAALGVGLAMFTSPSFFEAAIQQVTGRSYGDVFDDYQALCDGWQHICDEEGCNTIDVRNFIDEDDMADTAFAPGSAVTMRREIASRTVFFDFGNEEISFGLACALDEETPPTTGTYAENYQYTHLRGNYYQFVEEKP